MHIVIVSEAYPSKGDPSFTFVQQLAYSLSNEGHRISVIAPQSITKALIRHLPIKPKKSIDISPEGNSITVIRPNTLSFSSINNKLISRFADELFAYAVKCGLDIVGECDAIYCYFWHVGLLTARVSKATPLFVQASECNITIKPYMKKEIYLSKIRGVVCASKKNMDESLQAKLTNEKACQVIVNGYRSDQFYKIDKYLARRAKGISNSIFIIAFVGGFIERKGIRELSTALSQLEDVYSIFIGRGNCLPKCDNILFEGAVDHNEIVEYLNCADVFVLPTKAEGCCNAIIEALACGLPVISSNKSFNDEILDDSCSIRVNEDNVEEIRNAINMLRGDEKLLKELAEGALVKAKGLSIDIRGKKISEFISKMLY